MGEGGIISRAARGLAQTKGSQGHEDACEEGRRQKAGGPKIGCEEIGSQEIFYEEDEEKEVLILRSAHSRASRRMAAGEVTISWFETRKMRSSP
jgi:hypothetical protein